MSKVLVISGHPDLGQSNTNSVILSQLSQLDDAEIRRLDTLYPDYQIDVESEQEALLGADVIVLQFPFYWYSIPALLKKWLDDVFAYDFAYGSKGDKLKDKEFILSFTVGGPDESYSPLGYNYFAIEQLLRPLEQTAYLSGMNYHSPVYTHSMVYIPGVYNTLEDVQQRAMKHALTLTNKIKAITHSTENIIRKFVKNWFELFNQLPVESDFFTASLTEDINWKMPDGQFYGHDGFCEWYEIAKATFKPNCDHQIEQIEVQKYDDNYKVNLRVRLIAETFEGSPMEGSKVNMLVNEVWLVHLNKAGEVKIFDYDVQPVNA